MVRWVHAYRTLLLVDPRDGFTADPAQIGRTATDARPGPSVVESSMLIVVNPSMRLGFVGVKQ